VIRVACIGVGALLLAACSTVTGSSEPSGGASATTQSIEVERPGPLMGVSVPRSRHDELLALESAVGRPVDLIRWFQRWDDDADHPDAEQAMASGHRVHLSVRPAAGGGVVIPWRDLADAEPGTQTYDDLVTWVDRMVALPEGSFVTLNHEPETTDSAPNGGAADFVDMWRRWSALLDERGGSDLQTVWVMTGGAFSGPTADEWYPGDDAVDVIGVDPYNWYTCQGTERPWVDFADLLAAPLEYARGKDKPLAVAEFGSVEDPAQPGRKAQWFRDAADFLLRPEVADDIVYVSYFNVTAPGGTYPDCVWDFDTSPESAEAFAELVRRLAGG
jgi:hypothetical protein